MVRNHAWKIHRGVVAGEDLKNQNPTLVKVENSKLHSAAGTLASVAKS